MSALTVNIKQKFYAGHQALKHINFKAEAGEFIAITGPSGCGKSTLLNMIAGLITDYDGEIILPAPLRNNLVYLFQTPRLLNWRTIMQNLTLVQETPDEDLARTMLHNVGLYDCDNAFPTQLSLGMQKRASLARAFLLSPSLLLMDEPFSSLDEENAIIQRQLLRNLLTRHRPTTLFVTHDQQEAVELADRVLVLNKGPATIVKQVTVSLSPEERTDRESVAAFRQAHLKA